MKHGIWHPNIQSMFVEFSLVRLWVFISSLDFYGASFSRSLQLAWPDLLYKDSSIKAIMRENRKRTSVESEREKKEMVDRGQRVRRPNIEGYMSGRDNVRTWWRTYISTMSSKSRSSTASDNLLTHLDLPNTYKGPRHQALSGLSALTKAII